ncbi:hypothetical protein ES703_00816 [subsurface metagenome]
MKLSKCPKCGGLMREVRVGDRIQDVCDKCGDRRWVVRPENQVGPGVPHLLDLRKRFQPYLEKRGV